MKKIAFFLTVLVLSIVGASAQELPAETNPAEETVPANAEPSRSITLQKNQYLDVVYPGIGWIYLGEIDATSLLKYSGRKMNEENTYFTLRGREEGSAILHFFKNDALTGEYIDDYLEVTVAGSSRISDHVKAPMYADIVPPRPSFTKSAILTEAIELSKEIEPPEEPDVAVHVPEHETAGSESHPNISKTSNGGTVIQNTKAANQDKAVSTNENKEPAKKNEAAVQTDSLNASEILSMAQEAFDSKEYEKCLAYLDSFFEKTEGNMDEGMYLQGRTLESPSKLRDIKKSLSIYKTIVRQYPESTVWEKANERITYIERFYFDIR